MVIYMYIICTYDVKSKNCPKYMKLLRRYLFHVQESVFEGELTPATFNKLKKELNKIVTESDHISIYYAYNSKTIKKQELGKQTNKKNFIIE